MNITLDWKSKSNEQEYKRCGFYVADAHTIFFSLSLSLFIAFIFPLLSFHFSFYCMLWFCCFFTVLFAIKILFIYLISNVFLLRKHQHNDSWILKCSAELFFFFFIVCRYFFPFFFHFSKVHLKNCIVLMHFIVGFGIFCV